MRVFESYYLIQALRIVKFFYDIGAFEKALADYTWVQGEDFYEFFLNGMEHLAPIFDSKDLGEEVCCGGHRLYHFSDPALLEYYRLCRLYELQHSISPEENPYVKRADDNYSQCCNNVNGGFWTGYDDDFHPREIQVETCPEHAFDEFDLMVCIYEVMEFYRKEVKTLKNEVMRGPLVWFPALPAPKGGKACESKAKRRNRRKNKAV